MFKALSLLMCFVMGLGPTLTRAGCPTYWTEYQGKCYRHFGTEKTWAAAERHCQNLQSNLTSIHSDTENNFLYNYWRTSIRTPNKGFWIGLNDKDKEGRFVWDDGTSYNNYAKFLGGEPNNSFGVEDCVCVRYRGIMSDFVMGWDDLPCKYRLSYICRKAGTVV